MTTIRVSDENWGRLNRRKQPGESFDEVIERVLDQYEQQEVRA